ncbi:hypothetical protein BaRGS_00025921 [Batillaria attramentaria]|uniref:Uncharacterized protein n=1 Tax=Batillaria attramentaria TaxID=370345 RepID=A0ABD0K7H3_9CAEN
MKGHGGKGAGEKARHNRESGVTNQISPLPARAPSVVACQTSLQLRWVTWVAVSLLHQNNPLFPSLAYQPGG